MYLLEGNQYKLHFKLVFLLCICNYYVPILLSVYEENRMMKIILIAQKSANQDFLVKYLQIVNFCN